MKNAFLVLILCSFPSIIFSQNNKNTISGKVTEASNNENLMGVSITFTGENGSLSGTSTNEYGYYSMTLPKAKYKMRVSYIGFQAQSFDIDLSEDLREDISLETAAEELDEIVLSANNDEIEIKKPVMSKNIISVNRIKSIPTALGQPDIVKSLLLLPGVSSLGELSSGFNVRGGSSDQNLVLLDESIIFTTAHLFGLLSIFNPFVTKDITIYKGGIPSRYGGRISSVLEVYQKEGNSDHIVREYSIGGLSISSGIQGPIIKDKLSYLAAARFAPTLFYEINDSKIGFYDLNTKISYHLNKNNSIYLSGYFGRDVLKLSDFIDNAYGNSVINGRWNHIFGNKLFSNLSLIYSDYEYNLELERVADFKWDTNIRNFNFKYNFKHYLSDKIKLYYGVDNIYYWFNPGIISPSSETSKIKYTKLEPKRANEFSLYAGIEQKVSDKLSLEYGLRFSRFDRFGQKFNVYENDNPVAYDPNTKVYSEAKSIGTVTHSTSKSVIDYNNFEPRFSLSYVINSDNSIKMSYNRMVQYLQLVSNTISSSPFDAWAPAGPFIKPEKLDQYAIGYFKNINKTYSFQLEAYYKDIRNRIDYIDGANLLGNNAIERALLNGVGRSYGLEFLFKKDAGNNLTGWISYTLSKAEQRVQGRTPEEIGINNGEWYNSPQDRTHDISVTGSYKLNDMWTFNANFIFQTGRATTFPVGQYKYQDITIPKYSNRNEERLPSYNRLDISANYYPKKNSTREKKKYWTFGIYNLYNRKNAYSIDFKPNKDNPNISEAEMTYIFGIFPSVSYNVTF